MLLIGDPLAAGADVHARSLNGKTYLHYAVRRGSLEVVNALIISGADVNAHDLFGRTPLKVALHHHRNEIADVLRAHGAVERPILSRLGIAS